MLELLVVLLLLGLMAALVGPPLQRTFDGVVGSGERDDIRRQIESLPLRVRESGQRLELAAESDELNALLTLPEGWRVWPTRELRIEASGVCHRSRLIAEGRGSRWVYDLGSPYCQVNNAP